MGSIQRRQIGGTWASLRQGGGGDAEGPRPPRLCPASCSTMSSVPPPLPCEGLSLGVTPSTLLDREGRRALGPIAFTGLGAPISLQCSLNGPRCSTPFRGFSPPPAQRQAPGGGGGLLPSTPDPASAPFTCFPGHRGSPPPWVPAVSSSCHCRCPSPARCSHSLLTSAPSHSSQNVTSSSSEIPVWPFRPGTSPLRPMNLPWQRSSLGRVALLALG